MRRAAELLRERNESVAHAMTMEQGKPLAESRMEAAAGADVIDWLAEEGRRAYGRIVRDDFDTDSLERPALVRRPEETILVLITDLYEGGDRSALLRRVAALLASGVPGAGLGEVPADAREMLARSWLDALTRPDGSLRFMPADRGSA